MGGMNARFEEHDMIRFCFPSKEGLLRTKKDHEGPANDYGGYYNPTWPMFSESDAGESVSSNDTAPVLRLKNDIQNLTKSWLYQNVDPRSPITSVIATHNISEGSKLFIREYRP